MANPVFRRLPLPMRLFITLNISLSILAGLGFCYKFFVLKQHYLGYPSWCHFYYWPIGRQPMFPDVICFVQRFHHLHTPAFFSRDPRVIGIEPPFEYPAAAAFLYALVYLFPDPAQVYVSFVVISLVLLALLFGRALRKSGAPLAATATFLVASLLFSYPFWFEIGSANMEFCIFLLLLGGTAAFCTRRPYTAAVLYGAAAGMKIFPFVFVALFLARKQYRQIAVAAIVAGVLNLIGLRMISPSIGFAMHGISAGLAANRQFYILTVRRLETSFDHSLFGLVKRIAAVFHIWSVPQTLLTAYLAVTALGGLLLYFVRIRKLPVLNQITCLYLVAVLFPPTSHDYTLIHLYVPWGLLILYTLHRIRTEGRVPKVMGAFVCLAVACSSENELTFHQMGYSGQVKCVALICLFLLALKDRWEWPALEANTDGPAEWSAAR